jgi:hypothetical protein
MSNSLFHITRTAINSSDIENNPSKTLPTPTNAGFADNEEFGLESETQQSMWSLTPKFSDHASDSEKETEEEPDNTTPRMLKNCQMSVMINTPTDSSITMVMIYLIGHIATTPALSQQLIATPYYLFLQVLWRQPLLMQ